MYYVKDNTLFRNSELLSIKFLCAALPHISISSYSIINLTENDFKITTYQILAFAGSSLSMLVLDYAYDLPFLQIMNSNNIGIAVMQGLSGSFGIVLSVPATVLLAAWIYTWERER